MDPYLQSLIDSRKDALSCLKLSLDNVNQILRIVASLDSEISTSVSAERKNDNDASTLPPASAIGAVIGTDRLICQAAIIPPDGSSARTTGFQGRSRCRDKVDAVAEPSRQRRAEESRDKARREPDTSPAPAKDSFTSADRIKVEPVDDVVDVDNPSIGNDSGNLVGSSITSSDDDLADKQRRNVETSCRRSTRLQPMVRLEVLDDEDLQIGCKSKRKAGRPRKPRAYDEFLTDDEYEEKNRRYAIGNRRRKTRSSRKPVKILRDETWPSRIQPMRPAKSVSTPISVEIKDEDVNYD
ncbi:hypothetical protein TSAR_005038 [Trichomalopsis sarcophagae]|uniref:Uncharacterized protein n=1 Tax=Trichomalopsis sarcophagae TaxID=543379 RepID=A0A232FL03_9HYME|nr:hypothetical protein TSAR_005038 [Trichomalopsis sarcophagae]